MTGGKRREEEERAKLRVRRHLHVTVDEANYTYFPEKKPVDFHSSDLHQRVAVYARVSTGSIGQVSSFELQKEYYKKFVTCRPNWELVQIYADSGVSGTSLRHRDAFNRMIADCKAGKIDLIITKNVSRFARNLILCIQIVQDLAGLDPPVCVFFESEQIFSLDETSNEALTFLAHMAEKESHIRSRSMEASLRMRLDHGIPLTPKLLGYTHDSEGNLTVNPKEAPTVKLAFYMCLYGYSTQEIADTFNSLGRKSYLENVKWTASGVAGILRNERHCGDVLTRKTYTPNYRDHLAKKNRGQRPRSWYKNHHEAIVSRDDYAAVQKILDNARYGARQVLPVLRVIKEGSLRGFAVIHPRWAGFGPGDYLSASQAAPWNETPASQIEANTGDFDLRGFEVTRGEFLRPAHLPAVRFGGRQVHFNAACVRALGGQEYAALLIDPVRKRFAVRPAGEKDRCAVRVSTVQREVRRPRTVAATAFLSTVFQLFGWNSAYQYRISGSLWKNGHETVCVFRAEDAEVRLPVQMLSGGSQPLFSAGRYVRAVPESWTAAFGRPFYAHQSESLRCPEGLACGGEPVETGEKLQVTGREELRRYIRQELREPQPKEAADG